MSNFKITLFLLVILMVAAGPVSSQERQIVPNVMNTVEEQALIRQFTKNEDEFRYALNKYVFTREAIVQTIGLGGLITGTFRMDSFLTFTDEGQRFEKIIYQPVSTLTEIQITREDLDDLGGVNPFAINPRDVDNYTFTYIGKQRIDYLNLHVFDVRPKVLPNPKKSTKRYFSGRIWVDDRDNMIVKSKGKGVPEGKQRFPVVETWRENIDGKYWFPAYSHSDDELVFESGQVVKIKLRIRYKDYKLGRSEVIVLDDDTEIVEDPPKTEPNKPPAN